MKRIPTPCDPSQSPAGARTGLDRYRVRSRIAHHNDTARYIQSREGILGVGTISATARQLIDQCGGDTDLAADYCYKIGNRR